MADRPIIFSAPMVRALLEGRKTQTRRVLKPQPQGIAKAERVASSFWTLTPEGNRCAVDFKAPPHAPGDRLWVKEALVAKSTDQGARWPGYEADGKDVHPLLSWAWKRDRLNSMFCPRWASRLTLIVTDVRVQRLQDISEEDAMSEGIIMGDASNHRIRFFDLWDSLHGWGAREKNPWVCVLTFTVKRGNIDQIGGGNG